MMEEDPRYSVDVRIGIFDLLIRISYRPLKNRPLSDGNETELCYLSGSL